MISSDINTVAKFFYLLQRTLVVAVLFVMYFLFIGLAYIFLLISRIRIAMRRCPESNSYWDNALGYKPDMDDCLRQS